MNLELFISLLNLVLTSCHAPISLFPKLVSIQPYPSQTTKEIALYLLVIIATSSSKMLFYVKYSNFDLKMSICPLTIVIFEPKAVLFILFPTHFHNQIFFIPHFTYQGILTTVRQVFKKNVNCKKLSWKLSFYMWSQYSYCSF